MRIANGQNNIDRSSSHRKKYRTSSINANNPPLDSGNVVMNASEDTESHRTVRANMVRNNRENNFGKTATVFTGEMVRQGSSSINVAPPGFYSPYHTPMAWQVPTTRMEVYRWCQFWLDNDPRVAVAIDFYSDFPMSGFELECPDAPIREYFEKLCEKLNFDYWLPQILREYYSMGDAFVMLNLDCEHCQGMGINENGICDHKGATWSSVSILDPTTVDVSPNTFVSSEPDVYLRPNDNLLKVVQSGQPEEMYNKIPDMLKNLIKQRKPIKLQSMTVTHFKHSASSYQTFGKSIIRRLFPALAYKDKLRQAQWLIAERHILPIKIVKLGNDQFRATSEDIADVESKLLEVANDPLLTLVTHHAFDFDWIGAAGKVLQLTNEFELIENEMVDGLGLTRAILTGEGPTYSNAQVAIEVIAKRLETVRNMIGHWMEQKVFKPIAKFNGFTKKNRRGEDEYIYPSVKWNPLRLRDDSQKVQIMWQARQANEMSAKTFIEKGLDLDFDTEIENLRDEQMGSILTTPIGGVTGMGYGGDMGGIMGGMGGDMGGMMGGGMEGLDMGGLMGAMGDPGAAGGIPGSPEGQPPTGGMGGDIMASIDVINNAMERYSNIVKENNDRREKLMKKIASDNGNDEFLKYSSLTDDPLDRFAYVTGDGYRGPLTEDQYNLSGIINESIHNYNRPSLTLIEMMNGSNLNEHNNYDRVVNKFIKQSYKKKVEDNIPKQFFTSLELSLYKLILSMQLPYAFFAQFVIHSNPQFRVDGAFPQLKIAIEADGKEWHSDIESIEKDRKRDATLAASGWTVIRFKEDEIIYQPEDIAKVIQQVVNQKVQSIGVQKVAGIIDKSKHLIKLSNNNNNEWELAE